MAKLVSDTRDMDTVAQSIQTTRVWLSDQITNSSLYAELLEHGEAAIATASPHILETLYATGVPLSSGAVTAIVIAALLGFVCCIVPMLFCCVAQRTFARLLECLLWLGTCGWWFTDCRCCCFQKKFAKRRRLPVERADSFEGA